MYIYTVQCLYKWNVKKKHLSNYGNLGSKTIFCREIKQKLRLSDVMFISYQYINNSAPLTTLQTYFTVGQKGGKGEQGQSCNNTEEIKRIKESISEIQNNNSKLHGKCKSNCETWLRNFFDELDITEKLLTKCFLKN